MLILGLPAGKMLVAPEGAFSRTRGDARDYEALEFYILRHLMGIK
jgi:hypothetical protein